MSKAFRDSGSVHPVEAKPVDPQNAPRTIVTIRVPIRIDLDPDDAAKQLIDHVPPEYPAEARAAHVQGTVSLLVSMGKDGSVTGVKEISGPPELISAAVAAVKQWRYRPIISRGEPRGEHHRRYSLQAPRLSFISAIRKSVTILSLGVRATDFNILRQVTTLYGNLR